MSDWISNAKPPGLLPCKHNVSGLCPECLQERLNETEPVAESTLFADLERRLALILSRDLDESRDQFDNEMFKALPTFFQAIRERNAYRNALQLIATDEKMTADHYRGIAQGTLVCFVPKEK